VREENRLEGDFTTCVGIVGGTPGRCEVSTGGDRAHRAGKSILTRPGFVHYRGRRGQGKDLKDKTFLSIWGATVAKEHWEVRTAVHTTGKVAITTTGKSRREREGQGIAWFRQESNGGKMKKSW